MNNKTVRFLVYLLLVGLLVYGIAVVERRVLR